MENREPPKVIPRTIATEEYITTLQGHVDVRNLIEWPADMDPQAYYTIDKLVRQRLRKMPFGYDFSEVHNLELEIQERLKNSEEVPELLDSQEFGKALMERLSVASISNNRKPKLTYEEWSRKKLTSDRLKNKLIDVSRKEKTAMKTIVKKHEDSKQEDRKKKHLEWKRAKRAEAKSQRRYKKQEDQAKAAEDAEKKEQRQEGYEQWIQEDIEKQRYLQEQKARQYSFKLQAQAKKRANEEEQRERAEQVYQSWLRRKKEEGDAFGQQKSMGRQRKREFAELSSIQNSALVIHSDESEESIISNITDV